MSSFIEWPTIYGSQYFLPGIILVVLLLTLLLLMSSGRRRRADRARLAPDPDLDFGVTVPQPRAEGSLLADAAGLSDQGVMLPLRAVTPSLVTQPVAAMTQPVTLGMQPVSVVTQPVGVVTQPIATG